MATTKGKGFAPRQATIKRVEIRDSAPNGTETEEDRIAKEINVSKQSVTRETSNQPETKQVVKEDEKKPELDINALAQLINQQNQQLIESLKAEHNQQLEALKTESDAKVQELESKLKSLESDKEKAEQSQVIVAELFKMTGNPNPENITEKNINFNTQTSPTDKPDGAFQEALSIIESAEKFYKPTKEQGEFIEDFNRLEFDSFCLKNREQILQSMTKWGKKTNGWFQGSKPITQAVTTISDLPGGFLQILSTLVRQTHRTGLVWHQFATIRYDSDARVQQDIVIPRVNYLTSSTNPADYLLSGGGTYADLVTTSDNVSTGTTNVKVQEYGRGKVGAGTAISPVSFPNFVGFYSAYDLVSTIQRLLGRDYAIFENNIIRSQYDLTSVTLYNDGTGVTTDPTDLTAGDGLMTRNFLQDVYEYLYTQLVTPFPDSSFMMVLPYKAIKQLKRDLDDEWEAPSESQLMELTEMLIPKEYPDYFDGKISGYQGKVENIHIFEAGAGWGTGAAATAGVTAEATGGTGNSTFRQGYVFGDGAVGRGVAMPFTIRPYELTNFGRKNTYTWLSWEGIEAIDVDPTGTSDANQQLRVAKIKTADVAVIA